jgi:3-deoxy-D-manno-octulosonate 8-phosphate phosphatase (KDO 8-P phosphatase)
MTNFKQKLADVNTFIFDVDGVFTNGSLIIMPNGDQVRTMNIKDGYAVQLAIKKGFKIAIISGGKSEGVIKRFQGLGLTDIYMGVHRKTDAFEEYTHLYDINPEHILYMGDDLPDYEVMKKVGIPTCPADAAHEIREISSYISNKKGGEGCVRDIIEQVLKLKGLWVDE